MALSCAGTPSRSGLSPREYQDAMAMASAMQAARAGVTVGLHIALWRFVLTSGLLPWTDSADSDPELVRKPRLFDALNLPYDRNPSLSGCAASAPRETRPDRRFRSRLILGPRLEAVNSLSSIMRNMQGKKGHSKDEHVDDATMNGQADRQDGVALITHCNGDETWRHTCRQASINSILPSGPQLSLLMC